jgi:hypothetical protein
VRVDASWAFTSTHGSYDGGIALAVGCPEGEEGEAGEGEPVLAVGEPHADTTKSSIHIETKVSLRNMRLSPF